MCSGFDVPFVVLDSEDAGDAEQDAGATAESTERSEDLCEWAEELVIVVSKTVAFILVEP